jgi:hypothetical protein
MGGEHEDDAAGCATKGTSDNCTKEGPSLESEAEVHRQDASDDVEWDGRDHDREGEAAARRLESKRSEDAGQGRQNAGSDEGCYRSSRDSGSRVASPFRLAKAEVAH